MSWLSQLLEDYGTITILMLGVFSFIAGFIDAVVGGGGLITIPAMLIGLPATPLTTIFGTNKIAAFAGTSISAFQYSRRVKMDLKILLPISVCAAIASSLGARMVSKIDVELLKPLILVILIIMAVYTFLKKNIGLTTSHEFSIQKQISSGCLMGITVGFYDGFFGPGTGSFLVLGFVILLGYEFLKASAYAKVINCVTNFSALIVFIRQGSFIPALAVIMAVCNISGNFAGTIMAMKKGNHFVRLIFLGVTILLIVRYAYDIFFRQ